VDNVIKKIIAGIIVLVILLLAGFKLFYKGDNISKKLKNIGEEITSYHLEANMDISHNEETRSFYVTTDYALADGEDYFRISLLDKNINQEQIMISSKNGVHVLTPKLNQVYVFKGDYPLNKPKPYLYHTIVDQIKNHTSSVKTINDGYILSFSCTYENASNWVKEDIKLSSDLKPVWINIYDSANNVVVAISFTACSFNETFDDNLYDVEANMKNSKDNIISSTTNANIDDLPLYPSNTINATLKEQTEGNINNNIVYILSFDGDKAFTLVQKLIDEYEETNYVSVSGEIIETNLGIAYYADYTLTLIYNGVQYEIYSSLLTLEEMIEVAQSLDVVIYK
jgi:outer membrane lipoprotein-sorting protein